VSLAIPYGSALQHTLRVIFFLFSSSLNFVNP
jgi:hypothetical protein